MPRRTQTYIKSPWTGGINSSVDSGVLPDNDLVIADNVVFAASGSRLKREGLDQFDVNSNIPAVTHYASNATYTRTLTFAANLQPGTVEKLVVGERITISSTDATLNTNYGGTFYIDSISSTASVTFTDAGDLVTLASHDLPTGTPISFSVINTTTGISINTTYYVINISSSTFKVASSLANAQAGTALTLTTDGTGTLLKYTITYTHGTNIGGVVNTTASSTFTVTRASDYIDVRDYWRMDASYVKQQQLVAFTSQGKLFRFDSSGNRFEIKPAPEVSTVLVTNGDTANNTNGDWFKIYDSAGSVGVYMKTSGGADTPPTGLADRVLQVSYATGASANTIAAAIQSAVDADSKFTATVNTATVTITDTESGSRTDIADGTASGGSNPTGWTFAVTRQGRSLSQPFTASPSITRAASAVMNERFILCPNDAPIYYHPETSTSYYYPLAGSPPKSNSVSEHLGRLWMNDVENRDRLHYSTTGEPEEWQGSGDSGALDIGWGDGDPEGIIAVSPSFKGRIFVGKTTRLYQVTGQEPLTFFPEPITQGLGCAGNKSFVAVDMDDLLFVSPKGIHSVGATDQFGDFSSAFLTAKIQPTFREWPQSSLYKMSPTYIPELNSVAFNVQEQGQDNPSAFWFYNTAIKEWYKWPDLEPIASCSRLDNASNRRLLFADADKKLYIAQNTDYTDDDGEGGSEPYRYKIRTGTIYVDGNPQTIKGFKNISFLFRPRGRYSFTVKVWIDNLERQDRLFSQGVEGATLGASGTFVLGSSVLGSSQTLAPVTVPIDGYGRGIRFEIENSNQDEQVEIYGFIIEYELADIAAEVL